MLVPGGENSRTFFGYIVCSHFNTNLTTFKDQFKSNMIRNSVSYKLTEQKAVINFFQRCVVNFYFLRNNWINFKLKAVVNVTPLRIS